MTDTALILAAAGRRLRSGMGYIALLALFPAHGLAAAGPPPPLRLVADVPMPGKAVRFDYQSFDRTSGRLYIAHMNADQLVVFDTRARQVVANLTFPEIVPVAGKAKGRQGAAEFRGPDVALGERAERRTLLTRPALTPQQPADGRRGPVCALPRACSRSRASASRGG